MYELTFDYYQGPIEKLLDLINEKKLEITIVSLSEVTGGFLEYLDKLDKENVKSEVIVGFLSVASQLLLIKSKFVSPSIVLSEEEEEEIKNLEERLKIYNEFINAKKNIKSMWSDNKLLFSREFLKGTDAFFYPHKNLSILSILEAIKKINSEMEKAFKPLVKIKKEMISLKNKIEEIFQRIKDQPKKFNDLHSGEKREVIVLFLAILHLIKKQLIYVKQENSFAEIFIQKI